MHQQSSASWRAYLCCQWPSRGRRVCRSSWFADMLSRQSREYDQCQETTETDIERDEDLMVPLFESLLSQTFPALRSINCTGSLKGNIKISTFNGEVKASVFVLNEMQRNLGLPGHVVRSRNSVSNCTSGNPFCCRYAMIL